MAAGSAVGIRRRLALGAALADRSETEAPVGFVSAYDRLRLHKLAAEELAACDAGNLKEALRLSEIYEYEERRALGLTGVSKRAPVSAKPKTGAVN